MDLADKPAPTPGFVPNPGVNWVVGYTLEKASGDLGWTCYRKNVGNIHFVLQNNFK